MTAWLNGTIPCQMCMARDCSCECPTCTEAREQRERDNEPRGVTLGKALTAAMKAGKS